MVIAAITRSFVLPLTLGGFALAGLGYYLIVMRKRRAKFGYSSSTSSSSGDGSPKYWRGQPVDPPGEVKKRDGNIIEFPGPEPKKSRGRFGRKR